MQRPPSPDDPSDESRARLEASLNSLAGGRIDGAWVHPETGLVALSVYTGSRAVLGVAVGPRLEGVGWLAGPPRFRADATHPLAAALRAHLVDHRVREVRIDDEGVLWVIAGGSEVAARVGFVPTRHGEVRVIGATGNLVVRWPAGPEGLVDPAWIARAGDLARDGQILGERAERFSWERTRALLARAVQKRMTALARRAEAVREDAARLESVPLLQKTGRLLLAQGSRIPRGSKRATLEDWEEGGSIEVSLDPASPAKQQAEGFFAKAKRIARGEAVMNARLAETERSMAELAPVRDAVVQLEVASGATGEATMDEPIAALDALAAEARRLGVKGAQDTLARTSGGPRGAGRPEARRPYSTYRSASGRAILVGRGGEDNDALTTKHARPHDLWLHAKGIHGAHVVVPLDRGQSCPPDVLVDAATLAVHHSDARGEDVAEVSHVERRHVRKPKGSAPGAVVIEREKVLVVRMERARLERLLASREG
ncbi:MAG: NFACT RNA binding domain-containing protein [Deltaproteobacteria bacterium]